MNNKDAWKSRCVVVSPRHDFIRPWIRAYFANGNTIPLVIVPGPPGDWKDGDMEYCMAAADFCGGMVFDCSRQWKESKKLAKRAVLKNRVGWYTKKSILHAVASKLSPKAWAWIDDDAEVTGNLDDCFVHAERAPGFIYTQFYCPDSIDNRHPARYYRSNIDTGDKICWNSLVFFHGDANRYISEELSKDFPVEDDECVFGHLYKTKPEWHEGFCDFSIRNWQKNCKAPGDIPDKWSGKLLHYTSYKFGGEVKKRWAAKAGILPPAPFEGLSVGADADDGPIDAVFVIGTGSIDGNTELRYALRNLEKNCKFIRDVYICGFCPKWVDRTRVKHLEWPDRFNHAKDANIVDKLRHACEHPGIAKRILFCSDDQFQTRPCTWEDFRPRYLRAFSESDTWYDDMNRTWHTRLRKTLYRDAQRRKAAGLDERHVFYYQPHIWMPIDRDRFIDYAKWCNYETRTDTIIASGYFNFIDADGFPDKDNPVTFLNPDDAEVPKTVHVAYHDGSYRAALSILRGMFPERCSFELEDQASAPKPAAERSLYRPERSSDYSMDPSPANEKESREVSLALAQIRDDVSLNALAGEASRAEELRLFGVRGWRTVWCDIIDRIKSGDVGKRSDEAAAIVNSYLSNPDAMRTVRFGPSVNAEAKPPVSYSVGRPRREDASAGARDSLRERIRALRKTA